MNEYIVAFYDKKGRKRVCKCVAETEDEAKQKFYSKMNGKRYVIVSVSIVS